MNESTAAVKVIGPDGAIDEARILADILAGAIKDAASGKSREKDRVVLDAAVDAARPLAGRLGDFARAMEPGRLRIAGYAVGLDGPDGRMWYVHRAWSLGNLMRTPDPEAAFTWPSYQAARSWAEGLPEDTARQLEGRRLVAVALSVRAEVAGGPFAAGSGLLGQPAK